MEYHLFGGSHFDEVVDEYNISKIDKVYVDMDIDLEIMENVITPCLNRICEGDIKILPFS